MLYFDYHAASPPCTAAREAMSLAEAVAWANPSSIHQAGRQARQWLEQARGQVADAIGAQLSEVIFTSGGTEACNLGLRGLLCTRPARVVTTPVEHPAVTNVIREWERQGTEVVSLPVDGSRVPSAAQLEEVLQTPTELVAVQWVNHETGMVFPIAGYAEVCFKSGVPLFVDGTQALGKIPINVKGLGVTAMAFASHKMGGPAGVGALWVTPERDVEPVLRGGAQEKGRRPGSPDVVSLAGFGAAAARVADRLGQLKAIGKLRDSLEAFLRTLGASVNADGALRVATVTNVSFPGVRADTLVPALDVEGLCVSSGSACSSGLVRVSPVLEAMYPEESWRASSAVRFSLGPEITPEDIETAKGIMRQVLSRFSS
ncbi:MAG: cysteine desulfurase [Myxococcales bacterium]|nr:cysteine desulfurase [Myxococcales bacterium]MCB9708604.1 cysteine desulfurase [Myxococcales bacterium]